jgi:glycosyltransferase involved in cell wall biosynthesis
LKTHAFPFHLLNAFLRTGKFVPNFRDADIDDELKFIDYLDGFLSKRHIYQCISGWSRLMEKPFYLKVPKQIDLILTTAPMHIRKVGKIKLVQSLHDIIPCKRLEHPPSDLSIVFYKRLKAMAEYADCIISVSEFSKKEFLSLFPFCDEKKIKVVHQPLPIYDEDKTLLYEEEEMKAVLEKYRLKRGGFILFVGMVELRKNLTRLIKAYSLIMKKLNIPLVIAGSRGWGWGEILQAASLNCKKNVIFLDYIPNKDKLILYKNARAFVFPSLYEGFGLPPLEAMACACPTLLSNIPSLKEVCGEAAEYVDPHNIEDIAMGLSKVVEDEDLRKKLIEAGLKRVKEFNLESFAQRLEKVLRE